MIKLPGYRILGKYIDESSWTLYKAYSIDEDKFVGLKECNHEDEYVRTAENIHEYHTVKNLTHSNILQFINLEKQDNETYIVTDFSHEITLKE